MTSNIHHSGFDTIMPKALAGASTDRLMHYAHFVTTTGDSDHLPEALAERGAVPLLRPPPLRKTNGHTHGFLMATSLDIQRPLAWASQ
ncbi:hypothetical protein [Streptomyces sp. NBC_01643]|uniref:hypothetical protein n=1 Tax=Streptomyces sp. NBC_01643 TaxID=2975906 RepID=UPI003863A0B1|nr:hypothetical protein OHB03_42035 [Streptomyces sp. NBC_01643]